LWKFSPLQTTVSVIMLALVGNRPETLNIKQLIQEFIRHRVTVIRRRTEFLLAEARRRKHTVEGLLIAQLDIDLVISTIRNSPSRQEAKVRLQAIEVPGEMIARALGEGGYVEFQREQGVQQNYSLSTNQSEAIVSMQLGSLANLERENLQGEHGGLLESIEGYRGLLSDEANLLEVISGEMDDLKRKYPSPRRTEISGEELNDVNKDELIVEEPMVVTLSQRGYVKRTALSVYQAQNRGGKGIKGARSDDEDAVEHLFVSSTHSYLLFFTNYGKVYWQKVYDLPLQARTAKGRALVNLLNLSEGEVVQDCVDVREFDDDRYLLMATQRGIVKKTALSAYSRPMKGGIIAIKLDDDDRLIDVVKVSPGQDVVLSTAAGMAIRFCETDARAMGRNTRGVKGIKLGKGDELVGMVVAEEDGTLLSCCENGYGKRTPFGVGSFDDDESTGDDASSSRDEATSSDDDGDSGSSASTSSGMRYRRQKRGGKGLRDIKTSKRNGPVIGTLTVLEGDHVLMISSGGKIQRIRGEDISTIGRNTQGVRIMSLDDAEDKLVRIARIPGEVAEDEADIDITTDGPATNTNPEAAPDTESDKT